MKKAWWKESVIYQIYPRSFCDSNQDGIGDLNGITSKLDYIRDLGVNVIWLSPIYASPNDDNGYDISDYQAIMTEFGTMEDFDRLLSEAHARGLKIVMDLVVNHTSDEHAWFVESRSSRDNPKRDFYIWRDGKNGAEPNNWGSFFSGPAWKYDPATDQYYLHCFTSKQVDLNWENPAVRDAVFDMMTWWCEKGIDGFRMDVINLISKKEGLPDLPPMGDMPYPPCIFGTANGPRVHEYLQEMRRRVLSKYDLLTVGECPGSSVEDARRYANSEGTELNMVFTFEHMSLDGGPLGRWSTNRIHLPDLKKNLASWQLGLQDVAWNSLYYDNHDQPRIVSRLGDDSAQWRVRSAKSVATSLHMLQGTPYVYQGEELGMTNCPIESLDELRDVASINAYCELTSAGLISPEEMLRCIEAKGRDNARTPMQWTAGPNAGFTTGKPWIKVNPNYTEINAEAEVADPDSVFHYYRKLIGLRRNSPYSDLIVYGSFELLEPDDEQLFAYLRRLDGRTLVIACNLSGAPVNFDYQGDAGLQEKCLLANDPAAGSCRGIELPPWGARIWVLE